MCAHVAVSGVSLQAMLDMYQLVQHHPAFRGKPTAEAGAGSDAGAGSGAATGAGAGAGAGSGAASASAAGDASIVEGTAAGLGRAWWGTKLPVSFSTSVLGVNIYVVEFASAPRRLRRRRIKAVEASETEEAQAAHWVSECAHS